MNTFIRTFIFILILLPLLALLFFISSITLESTCDSGSTHAPPPPPIKKFNWSGKTGLVTFWFDDAWSSQYKSGVIQLMDKEGWVGAISVPTKLICTPHYMTWDQLRKLQTKGWEITSHAVSHICDPSKYDDKTTAYELLESKKTLESKGFHAEHFVIPYGYNPQVLPKVVAFTKAHYRSYRRAGEQVNPLPVTDPYNLTSFSVTDTTTEADIKHWIDEAIQKKGWLILVFHQIDNRKLRYNINVDAFKRILAIVKKANLPVVLPTQVLEIKSTIKKPHKPRVIHF